MKNSSSTMVFEYPVRISVNINKDTKNACLLCHYLPGKIVSYKDKLNDYYDHLLKRAQDAQREETDGMPYTKFLFFNEPDRPDFIMDLIENHNYTLNEIYSFMEAVHNGMSWINVENTHIIQVISDEELKKMFDSKAYTANMYFNNPIFKKICLKYACIPEHLYDSKEFRNYLLTRIFITKRTNIGIDLDNSDIDEYLEPVKKTATVTANAEAAEKMCEDLGIDPDNKEDSDLISVLSAE